MADGLYLFNDISLKILWYLDNKQICNTEIV